MKVYITMHIYDTETGAAEVWSVHATHKAAEAALAAETEPLTYKNWYGETFPAFYIVEYPVEE